MRKEKFWMLCCSILLIINVATVIMVFFNPFALPKEKAMALYVNKRLNLNKTQADAFRLSVDKHRDQKNALIEQDFNLQDELFQLLIKEQIDSIAVKKCIAQMATIREKAEWNNFTHFRELRNICTPEQQAKFEIFSKEFLNNFRKEGVKKK